MATRRQFLAHCSVLAVGAGLTSPAALAAPLQSNGVALHEISFRSFARQLGTTFSVSRKSAPAVQLELMEAKPILAPCPQAHLAEDTGNEKFSLLFRGPAAAALGQNTHLFEHADIGEFAMFIVPVSGLGAGHVYYEAVFNRPSAQA